jgi:hypothetical protein
MYFMCYGPVRVRWGDKHEGGIDEKLVVLFGLDLIHIDNQEPHIASPNEFDFYFLARENITFEDTELGFWFPFLTEPMPMEFGPTKEQPRTEDRRDRYLRWQYSFLDDALKEPNCKSARSFGWNEKETRRILSLDKRDDVIATMRSYYERAMSHDFSLRDGISIRPLRAEEIVNDRSHEIPLQHFVATLNGEIEKGQMFHIYFKAQKAIAEPGRGACSGTAPMYFYNRNLEQEFDEVNDPFKGCPLVPCAMLQVSLLFPTKADLKKETYVSSGLVGDIGTRPTRTSPADVDYLDWRWFMVFNTHSRVLRRKFRTTWTLEDCPKLRPRLREKISKYFNMQELIILASDLRVDLEDIPGLVKSAKVEELIKYLDRRGQLPKLREVCLRYRPRVRW